MTNSEKCFIITAHTLHMGKAAEILFTSQQAVSDNIRRLEKEHGVTLFFRKPQLALTPEGRILLKALERIQIIENNMKNDLQLLHTASQGTLRFGMGSYRVHDSVVEMLTNFRQLYPDIRVDVMYEDTRRLEELLLRGQLDVIIGFNIINHEDFDKRSLIHEQPGVMGTDSLLQRYFLPDELDRFSREGISVKEFETLPLIANYPIGSLWLNYKQTFDKMDIHPHIIASSNDFSKILRLCAADYGVALCPLFLSQIIKKVNSSTNRFNPIHIFPFPALGWVNSIDLATHKMASHSNYLEDFIQIITTHIASPRDNFTL